MDEWILFYLSTLKALSDLIPGPPYASTIVAIAGRLAYVGYIWVMLSRQMKHHSLPRDRRQKAYRDFRRGVVVLMNLDAVLFIIATVKNSNEILVYQPLLLSAGMVLLLAGILSKFAAIKVLGSRGYYWGDFYLPEDYSVPVQKGIYRYLKHPMYNSGYLHAYGFAFIGLSWTGLALAGFMQLTIKLFERIVERQHVLRLYGKPLQ